MVQPPSAPFPNIAAFRRMDRIKVDDTLVSQEQQERFKKSVAGRRLQQCHETCSPFREKFEASSKALREARDSGDEEMISTRYRQRQFDAFHYRYCQISTVCPGPTRVYANCWQYAKEQIGPDAMWELSKANQLEDICKPERELIVRCMGRLVSSSVDALEVDRDNCTDGVPSSFPDDPDEWL